VGILLYIAALTLPAPALAVLAVRLKVFPTVRKTYFFWAAVSLLNFGFLAFLPFPPLLLLKSRVPGDFVAFLLPPACAGALIVLALALGLRFAMRGKRFWVGADGAAPYLVNLAFFVAFVVAADVYKIHLIQKALVARQPECIQVAPFLTSVMNAGGDFQFFTHAVVVEGGRNYYWSYSRMTFFQGNEQLDPSFPCTRK